MRNFRRVSHSIIRRFSIAAFREFLPTEIIKQAALKYRSVRDRALTVESYLWLSVFFQLNGSIGGLTELLTLGWHYVGKKLHLPPEQKSLSKQAFSRRNVQLPWQVWRDIFAQLVALFAQKYGQGMILLKQRFIIKLVDATTLDLAASLQRWYGATSNHAGRAKNAMMKVLTVFNLSLGVPEHIEMARGTTNEKKIVKRVISRLKEGVLALMDLGFWSFQLFDDLTGRGVFFIIPLREGTAFRKKRRICKGNWLVRLGKYRTSKSKHPLRLVRAICPSSGRYRYYVTNILNPELLSAQDIASAYALRWQIEIFFRDLKTLLPLRLNLSRDINGIKAQLYIALITYVLVQFLLRKAAAMANSPVEEFSFAYAVKVVRSWLQQHWASLYLNPEKCTEGLLESIIEFSHIHAPKKEIRNVKRKAS